MSDSAEAPPPAPAAAVEAAAETALPAPPESAPALDETPAPPPAAAAPAAPLPSALRSPDGRTPRAAAAAALHVAFSPHVTVADAVFHAPPEPPQFGVDTFERLYKDGVEHVVARKKRAAELEAAAAAPVKGGPDCPFTPTVSALAQGRGKLPSFKEFLAQQDEWAKKTEKRLKQKGEKLFADAHPASPFEDLPKRTHSQHILRELERRREYHGPVSGWNEHFARYLLKKHKAAGGGGGGAGGGEGEEGDAQAQSTASTTPSRNRGGGGGSSAAVFDRLYREAEAREVALRVIEEARLEREARELFRPATNESSASALASGDGGSGSGYDFDDADGGRTASSSAGTSRRVDELLAKGAQYRQRREERAREAAAARVEHHPFRPATNPNSRRILLQRAAERLAGAAAAAAPAAGESGDDYDYEVGGVAEDAEYPFPTSGSSTARGTGALDEAALRGQRPAETKPPAVFDVDLFCSRVERAEAERAQRIAALRRQTKLSEVAECTFRPSITRTSAELSRRPSSAAAMMSGTASPASTSAARRAPTAAAATQRPAGGAAAAASFRPAAATGRPAAARPASAAAKPRGTAVAAHAASGGGDGDELGGDYLQHLEEELRGVIAEWHDVSDFV